MANNLKRLRKQRRLTQDQTAELLGTTRNQYAKLERGTRGLNLRWIERAAKIFGVDPGEIVTDGATDAALLGQLAAALARLFDHEILRVRLDGGQRTEAITVSALLPAEMAEEICTLFEAAGHG